MTGTFPQIFLVSKSLDAQNKYLYNYIHKLEFLISQSQQERSRVPLKFKRIIGHIDHHLASENMGGEAAHRVLKSLQTQENDHENYPNKKEQLGEISGGRDFLLEALNPGPKPFNNNEKGYGSNFGEQGKVPPPSQLFPAASAFESETGGGSVKQGEACAKRLQKLCETTKQIIHSNL